MKKKYTCNVCGYKTLDSIDSYEICDLCGWEDDPIQGINPLLESGANNKCLKEFQDNFFKKFKNEQINIKKYEKDDKRKISKIKGLKYKIGIQDYIKKLN